MQSWQLVAKCIAMTIGDSSSAYSLEITLWFSLPTFLAQSRCFGRIFKRKNEKWGCGNQHYCNTKRQIRLSCLWFAGTLKFPCSLKVFPFEPRVGSIPPPYLPLPIDLTTVWRKLQRSGAPQTDSEYDWKCSFEEFVYAKTQSGIDMSINISISDMMSWAYIRIGRFLLVINLGCYIAVNSDSALELLQHRRMQASTETAKFSAC